MAERRIIRGINEIPYDIEFYPGPWDATGDHFIVRVYLHGQIIDYHGPDQATAERIYNQLLERYDL